MESGDKKPLCVDLDGTLVLTDTLVESVFALLRRNALYLFLLPLWLLKGKAGFKAAVAGRVRLDPATLPYAPELTAHLRQRQAAGQPLMLVTASDQGAAQAVADHLGFFDQVLGSDGVTNLKGAAKAALLQQRFGNPGFAYAGNSKVDLPVWAAAEEVIVVNPSPGVLAAARRQGEVGRVFDAGGKSLFSLLMRALRPHQWLKNGLLFIPLLMAHRVLEPALLSQALLAFAAFSLCASSVYLLNDLLDLDHDRRHPVKRLRPFASGALALQWGMLCVPLLLLGAFAIAWLLPGEFLWVLALYYAVTLAYSLRLKRSAGIDVITLAGLYTLRIIAGAAAVGVAASFWLLAFSMFLFLSLALVKRYAELRVASQQDGPQAAGQAPGRGYSVADLETLAQFGSASGFMAVGVLALYINGEAVRQLYQHPMLIWLLCPLVLYLVMRVWLLARRDELLEDPVVFFMRDARSLLAVLAGGVLMWLAA